MSKSHKTTWSNHLHTSSPIQTKSWKDNLNLNTWGSTQDINKKTKPNSRHDSISLITHVHHTDDQDILSHLHNYSSWDYQPCVPKTHNCKLSHFLLTWTGHWGGQSHYPVPEQLEAHQPCKTSKHLNRIKLDSVRPSDLNFTVRLDRTALIPLNVTPSSHDEYYAINSIAIKMRKVGNCFFL